MKRTKERSFRGLVEGFGGFRFCFGRRGRRGGREVGKEIGSMLFGDLGDHSVNLEESGALIGVFFPTTLLIRKEVSVWCKERRERKNVYRNKFIESVVGRKCGALLSQNSFSDFIFGKITLDL